MLPLSLATIKQILGFEHTDADATTVIRGIKIDSRQITAGDLYVAIVGERLDGHDFIAQARANDAAACLVSQGNAEADRTIVVSDTRLALKRLARYLREQFAGQVIALTGSVGKTTTKQMLKSILAVSHSVSATPGNLNNYFGVPLSIFAADPQADFWVLELGSNRPGEIAYLTDMVCPDVALVTQIAAAHLEGFGDLAGVAQEKFAIYEQLAQRPAPVAIINQQLTTSTIWQEQIKQAVPNVHIGVYGYAIDKSEIQKMADSLLVAENINAQCDGFVLRDGEGVVDIQLPVRGEHLIANALAAAAVARAVSISLVDIAQGLAQYQSLAGRQMVSGYPDWRLTLIDDSYNASPSAVLAAIEALTLYDGKKWVVLGQMAELGDQAAQLHEELGVAIKDLADQFFLYGENMRHTAAAIGDKAQWFADKLSLTKAVLQTLQIQAQQMEQKQDAQAILIKGSLSTGMASVVAALQVQLAQSPSMALLDAEIAAHLPVSAH